MDEIVKIVAPHAPTLAILFYFGWIILRRIEALDKQVARIEGKLDVLFRSSPRRGY